MLSKQPKGSSIVLKSRYLAVEAVCKRILGELEAENYNQDDIFAVHLGLEEAFINAVKHGNKGITDKNVIINYSIDPNQAEITVTDEGDGFDPESVPDPREGDNIFKVGGRGLFLIRAYMDGVDFNRTGNSIKLIKYNSNEKKKSRLKPGKPIKK
jgi:serine/threonine-protein kinase RsbW